MNYFRQSLLSLPTYIPEDVYRPDFGLYSLDDILNQPVISQDRRDLNRIYEQADISTKRNSIMTINNKKQKKLIGTAIGAPPHLPIKSLKDDSHPPQFQIPGRQRAFFQQINPTDVEKTLDDNIFDYRLHMKLARGEQIFKVEEMKRKPKKRNTAGKECECCGKEVMRNHRCQHTLCELKCGKVTQNIKKPQSKKDAGSSISDSKDESWSGENIQKMGRSSNGMKIESDKKSKLNRRQSSPSNKQQFGEPSQLLLASIEKLLMTENNNFTYKVLEIKEYESEEEEQDNQENDEEEKDLDMEYSVNKRLFVEDEAMDEKNQEKNVEEKPRNYQQQGKYEENGNKNELGQRKVPETQKQSKYESQRNQTRARQQNETRTNPSSNKAPIASKIAEMSRNPPSESESQSNRDKTLRHEPEVGQIGINSKKRRDISNLESSSDQMIQQIQQNNDVNDKRMEQNQNQEIPSVPDLQQQNSLDDQIDAIIDPHVQNNQSESFHRNYHSSRASSELPQKISKKESKKIKTIQKERLLSQKIEDIDPISDLDQDQDSDRCQDQIEEKNKKDTGNGQGKGKERGMGRGKGILQEQLEIYQQESRLLEEQDGDDADISSDSLGTDKVKTGYLHARKFPKSEHIKSQPNIRTQSSDPHPLTPKRQIPNMQSIIKQIQIESQTQKQEKGLGRGKVFGRGLGVLEEAEELEKEVEQDGMEGGDQTIGKGRKRVKVEAVKQEKTQKAEQQKWLGEEGEDELCDKFQQLIEEEQVVVPDNMNISKSYSDDKLQALQYKHYLQKRSSIAVRLTNNYGVEDDQEEIQEINERQVQCDEKQENAPQVENQLSEIQSMIDFGQVGVEDPEKQPEFEF